MGLGLLSAAPAIVSLLCVAVYIAFPTSWFHDRAFLLRLLAWFGKVCCGFFGNALLPFFVYILLVMPSDWQWVCAPFPVVSRTFLEKIAAKFGVWAAGQDDM